MNNDFYKKGIKVGEWAGVKEVVFLEGFKEEPLENILEYWALMNVGDLGALSITENPKIKEAISVIKQELKRGSGGATVKIKDLLK